MNPAQLSAKFVEKIPLFRGDASREVAAHARHIASGHVLKLPATVQDPPLLLATSPGEVNERLLQALFGQWPPGRPRGRRDVITPMSGVSVRYVDWSEWCALSGPDISLSGKSAP
ncbi:hypothetical protein J7U46_21595 [Pelomonas sp. V22]|uniref:hypothetical protein n=1 Tax=Pelomonas sp. V22 TaxID=2822139 RepID=UPI0024A8A3E7|nr:hypothetical protein [Pelomonas sp. V22]MDI4635674.1 hypothetical protein [Pelomonas sp. V22]